jgi:hypothetical protein
LTTLKGRPANREILRGAAHAAQPDRRERSWWLEERFRESRAWKVSFWHIPDVGPIADRCSFSSSNVLAEASTSIRFGPLGRVSPQEYRPQRLRGSSSLRSTPGPDRWSPDCARDIGVGIAPPEGATQAHNEAIFPAVSKGFEQLWLATPPLRHDSAEHL